MHLSITVSDILQASQSHLRSSERIKCTQDTNSKTRGRGNTDRK